MRKILIFIPIIAGARIRRLLNDIAQKEREKAENKTEKEPIKKRQHGSYQEEFCWHTKFLTKKKRF